MNVARGSTGWVLALALTLWAWVSLPVIAGRRTFFLRDVFTTHLIQKAFGARELQAGRIPAVDPAWVEYVFDKIALLVGEGDAAGLAAAVGELAGGRTAEVETSADSTGGTAS